MAAPVSHIVYSDHFLNQSSRFLSGDGRYSFIAGSLFPDIIRLLPNIKRGVTHDHYPIDLNFIGLDSFHAGWKFHLYCDKVREQFLKARYFYDIPHTKDCGYAANKFLEDMLIWNRSTYDITLLEYLRGIDRSFDFVDGKIVNKWYCLLAEYIETQPTYKSIETLLGELMTPSNDIDVALGAIKILEKNQGALQSLSNVCGNIMILQKGRELPLQLS